jgi:hypothetical protein
MNLIGQTVAITVNEPYEWTERNLLGTIISQKDDQQILVKLTKSVKGKKLTSDLIKLKTRYKDESFKPLTKSHSVTVGGTLVEENSSNLDYIIIGDVIIK